MMSGYKPGIGSPYYGHEDSNAVVLYKVLVMVPSFAISSVGLMGPRQGVKMVQKH